MEIFSCAKNALVLAAWAAVLTGNVNYKRTITQLLINCKQLLQFGCNSKCESLCADAPIANGLWLCHAVIFFWRRILWKQTRPHLFS